MSATSVHRTGAVSRWGNASNRGDMTSAETSRPTASDQLDKLAARAKEAREHAEAARGKARVDLEQEVKTARASAQAQADKLRESAEANKGKIICLVERRGRSGTNTSRRPARRSIAREQNSARRRPSRSPRTPKRMRPSRSTMPTQRSRKPTTQCSMPSWRGWMQMRRPPRREARSHGQARDRPARAASTSLGLPPAEYSCPAGGGVLTQGDVARQPTLFAGVVQRRKPYRASFCRAFPALNVEQTLSACCPLRCGHMACGIVGDELMLRSAKKPPTLARPSPRAAMDFTVRPMGTMVFLEPARAGGARGPGDGNAVEWQLSWRLPPRSRRLSVPLSK